MAQLQLTIATPERQVYQNTVDSVTLPTHDGEITVLPHHIALSTILQSGELAIRKGESAEPYAVSGGFIEVRNNSVTVLADTAEHVTEIDEQRAAEAIERARRVTSQQRHEAEDLAAVTGKLERDLNRLRIVRKYRHRGHQGITHEGVFNT